MRRRPHSLQIAVFGQIFALLTAGGIGRAQQPSRAKSSPGTLARGEVGLNLRQCLDDAHRQQQLRRETPSVAPAESEISPGKAAVPVDESVSKLRAVERRLAQFFPRSGIRLPGTTGLVVIGHPVTAAEAGELLEVIRDELTLAQVSHPLALRQDFARAVQRVNHEPAPATIVLLQVQLIEFRPDKLQERAAAGSWVPIAQAIDRSFQSKLRAEVVDAEAAKRCLGGMAGQGIAKDLAAGAVILPLGHSASLPRTLDPSHGKADTVLARTGRSFSVSVQALDPVAKQLQFHLQDEVPDLDFSRMPSSTGSWIPEYEEPKETTVSLGAGQVLLCVYNGNRLASEMVAVPILGSLPLVGRAFQRQKWTEVRTGALLAITAEVLPQPAESDVVPAASTPQQ